MNDDRDTLANQVQGCIFSSSGGVSLMSSPLNMRTNSCCIFLYHPYISRLENFPCIWGGGCRSLNPFPSPLKYACTLSEGREFRRGIGRVARGTHTFTSRVSSRLPRHLGGEYRIFRHNRDVVCGGKRSTPMAHDRAYKERRLYYPNVKGVC